MKRPILVLVALALSAPASGDPRAPSWHQWGGPERRFTARSAPLADAWPAEGPETSWRRPLGKGHSGLVVDDEAIFTAHGGGGTGTVVALSRDTGETLWEHAFPVRYETHLPDYDGPHATPLLVGSRLIAVAIDATVHAFDASSGKVLWKRDLVQDHDVELPQFGYAASPLARGELLLLPGLGGSGPGAIALRMEDGGTAWARHDFRSSHASPVSVRAGGRDHAVFHGMDWLYGLDPATGDVLWKHRLRTDAFDNVSFTPLWDDARQQLIVSHGYDSTGAQALGIAPAGERFVVTPRWTSRALAVDHGNGAILDGVLYGSHRATPGVLVALDLEDGSLLWRERLPKATLVVADGKLLVLDERGELYLATPDRRGLRIRSRLRVLQEKAWTVPSVVGSDLYLRDRADIVALRLPRAAAPERPAASR